MSSHPRAAARTVLVTGAGRGLGAAFARRLARDGWRVVCNARTGADVARVADEIARDGGAAMPFAADVTDRRFAGGLAALAPRVDALVHAAGAFAPYGGVAELADDDLRRVLDVHLRAAVELCRALVPGMRERGFGRVVLVGSVAARAGAGAQAAYAAAKAGLVGLTRSVAVEAGGAGVTVNLVELGLFDTERTRSALSEGARAALLAATPLGRCGRPEEAAAVVAFLASEDASFVNGATVPVTGGLGLGLGLGGAHARSAGGAVDARR